MSLSYSPVEHKVASLAVVHVSALQGSPRKFNKMAIAPPLSVGWGYGIVLGLGALFAFGMVSFVPWPLSNFTHKLSC